MLSRERRRARTRSQPSIHPHLQMAQAAAARAVAAGKLQRTDVDENVLGFLRSMEATMAQQVIHDFVEADLSEVKSRSGYLLAMLRHRVRKARRATAPPEVREKPEVKQRRQEAAEAKRKREEEEYQAQELSKQQRKQKPGGAADGVQHTLFVNQVPYAATRAEIAAHFAPMAGVDAVQLEPSVRMVMRNGSFGGTAFVDMPSVEAMQAGVEALDQSVLLGRTINVRSALTRDQLTSMGVEKPKGDRGDGGQEEEEEEGTSQRAAKPSGKLVKFEDGRGERR